MKNKDIKIKKIFVNKDREININWLGKDNNEYIQNFAFIHSKANVKSRINIKAVLLDNSVFNIEALIVINRKAKKVDSYLSIKVLVISDEAYARAVPSLEILENDVKAGHSATISFVNKEEIYYLRSRGISELDAQNLLINSFLNS